MEEYFNVKEVAEYLRCAEVTIRKWVREGKIPYCRLGAKKLFFRKSSIDEWIASKEIK